MNHGDALLGRHRAGAGHGGAGHAVSDATVQRRRIGIALKNAEREIARTGRHLLDVDHGLHAVALALGAVARDAAEFDVRFFASGDRLVAGGGDVRHVSADTRRRKLFDMLVYFRLHLVSGDLLVGEFLAFFEYLHVQVVGALTPHPEHLVDQRLAVRLRQVGPGRHRRARHAAEQHGVQVLAGGNVVLGAHEAEVAGEQIARFGEQKIGRDPAAVAALAVTGGAVRRVEPRAAFFRRRRRLGGGRGVLRRRFGRRGDLDSGRGERRSLDGGRLQRRGGRLDRRRHGFNPWRCGGRRQWADGRRRLLAPNQDERREARDERSEDAIR